MLCILIISNVLSSKRLSWPSYKSTWGFREEDQHMEVNRPWIYANHHDPYILRVNFGLPNHLVWCNGYIECSDLFVAPLQGGGETLSIIAVGDEQCATEWRSLSSLGPPHPVTREELIGTYHIFPVTIWIKSNFVLIPQLRWTRLNFLQVVWYFL